MTQKKLYKILDLLGPVQIFGSYKWDIVTKLVASIATKEAEVIHKEWHDTFKKNNPQYYPLDLGVISTWSTFSDTCVDIMIAHVEDSKKKKLHCLAKIYDGDSFGGQRTRLRFTAEIYLPKPFILNVEHSLIRALDRHAELQYEQYLSDQMQMWTDALKRKILED